MNRDLNYLPILSLTPYSTAMILTIFEGLDSIGLVGRLLTVFIFTAFFPLTAISFFRYLVPKKQREYNKNLRDMGLAPSDAANKTNDRSQKFQEAHSVIRYTLPVSFVTLICLIAIFYILFAERFLPSIGDSVLLTGAAFGEGAQNKQLIEQSIAVLTFTFLGGFIWSATNTIRRLIANDIAPSVYYSAGIRILLASVVALVFSFMLGKESGIEMLSLQSSLTAIAFLTGMFPERILSYLIKVFQKYVNPDNLNTDQLSLYRIEGISMQHKERLEEIGIDNAQNLASASLTQLLVETPFKLRQVLDWIGQAKLLCYAKDDMEKLRSVGIRTVFDLFSHKKTPGFLQEISSTLGIEGPLLHNIYDQVMADRGINTLYGFLNGVNTPWEPDKPKTQENSTEKEPANPPIAKNTPVENK